MTDKTDRELLELSAKAAGYDVRYVSDGNGAGSFFMEPSGLWWGPNIDDGDALRLAVKLGVFDSSIFHHFRALERFGRQEKDDCYATRRAIVRAAAEIGESMP